MLSILLNGENAYLLEIIMCCIYFRYLKNLNSKILWMNLEESLVQ